ncbi:MAG: hypothetical protein ACJAZP_001301 [Psychromonas sp.]|jgi:hypothetical protein|uniref:hypothetical protein n=1 Tax=Psychromonas sp. TaxID=1884585 RepID=UPI0039E4D26B
MTLFKKLQWLILACALAGMNLSLSAHELNDTSAQVILRDGQVEVRVITDIDHLISALQDNQAWLLGDIDTVMPENLSAVQQADFIKKALKQKMHLMVNNKVISFERVTLANNTNTDRGEIVFQAQHAFPEVKNVSISFHKSLGAVHVSFVKPQYKLLSAGERADVVF